MFISTSAPTPPAAPSTRRAAPTIRTTTNPEPPLERARDRRGESSPSSPPSSRPGPVSKSKGSPDPFGAGAFLVAAGRSLSGLLDLAAGAAFAGGAFFASVGTFFAAGGVFSDGR